MPPPTDGLTREQANYLMHCLYSVDLADARHSLSVLRQHEAKEVRWIILRDVVIAYARPFSGNKDDRGKPHRLSAKRVVPRELRSLHRELMAVRNELFAHTDYKRRNPRVNSWPTPNTKAWGMVLRAYDFAALDAQEADIERLVYAVDTNLNREIERLTASVTGPARTLSVPDARSLAVMVPAPGRVSAGIGNEVS